MAWWTDLITKNRFRGYTDESEKNERKIFSVDFKRATKTFLYENFVDVLYVSLSLFTYLYVILSIITFVFQDSAAKLMIYGMEALSEPYLGALAIYVIVKEIERKNAGIDYAGRRGEFFVVIWTSFLLGATAITYLSPDYHLNEIYQTILKNSLAAVIIRVGSLLR